jgi:hypothetical protein
VPFQGYAAIDRVDMLSDPRWWRETMDRITDGTHDLVELGAASTETWGDNAGIIEFIGLMLKDGLSRD